MSNCSSEHAVATLTLGPDCADRPSAKGQLYFTVELGPGIRSARRKSA